jgi:hypothetical protein
VRTGYVALAVGMTPESRNKARNSVAMYIQKNVTISFLPTAVYLLRMCRIMIAVMMIATICTKHVAVKSIGKFSFVTIEGRDENSMESKGGGR